MIALALLLLLGVARVAFAWNEPSGFRDAPWGASMETVKEKIRRAVVCRNDVLRAS